MKTLRKLTAIALLLVLLAALLVGCGKKSSDEKPAEDSPAVGTWTGDQKPAEDSPAVGTWKGDHLKMVGDETILEETFSLDLNADGTGVHHRDNNDFNVTWELDGTNFTMKETFIGDPIIYTGTLSGDKLKIFNGDPEDIWTFIYYYTKQQ